MDGVYSWAPVAAGGFFLIVLVVILAWGKSGTDSEGTEVIKYAPSPESVG